MKLGGLGLLLSGWLIVRVAVTILPLQVERAAFIVAGILVEIVGVVLVARGHRAFAGGSE